jgi:MoaA/NifB/PqqE/SkfB family radical SAM enzyme
MLVARPKNFPTTATIFPGYVCNLACVMCSPQFSSKWRTELNAPVIGKVGISPDKYDFTGVDTVIIGGGEPLLNKETFELLDILDPSVYVSMHHNGTILPTASFYNQCSKFKEFKIVFSIDDTNERFEYIRYPGKWNTVEQNILKIVNDAPENVSFDFNITVSELNSQSHTSVIEWIAANSISATYSINSSHGFTQTTFAQDIPSLDAMDKRRNTNWRTTFPEIADKYNCS